MTRAQMVIEPAGRRVEANIGMSILESMAKAGIQILSPCRGIGTCGRCKVHVLKGMDLLTKCEKPEARHLSKDELLDNVRLACFTGIREQGRISILIPPASEVGRYKLQIWGLETKVPLKPAVTKIEVALPPPTLQDPRSDLDRLKSKLMGEGGGIEADIELIRRIPEFLRRNEWKVSIALWNGRRIVDCDTAENLKKCYGLAVDIGTTKVACCLLDMKSGETLYGESFINPQTSHGADVVTRISYTLMNSDGLRTLQAEVIDGLNNFIKECCSKLKISEKHIYEMTVVGNTAMHHIFLGLPVEQLVYSPYVPVVRDASDTEAWRSSLKMKREGNVHVLPVIAGFVGADCVADILASRIHKVDKMSLLVDIGTNTEIVLGDKRRLVSCSTASGPAFEGAHIKFGMPASSGAIERISVKNDFDVEYATIDDVKPKGMCGSAIVDAVSSLLWKGIIDYTGRFQAHISHSRIRVKNGIQEFVVAWKDESQINDDISITQADVRQVQLAKAAMNAGTNILMAKLSIQAEEIERVYIAGAFGTYMNAINAQRIGLYPQIPLDHVFSIGNAALSGARMALLSVDAREEAKQLSRAVEYVELAAEPDFQKRYFEAINFPVPEKPD